MEILQLAIGGAGVFGSRHVSQQGRLKKKKKKEVVLVVAGHCVVEVEP